MSKVLTVTEENFDAEVLQSDVPVLVDFWAEWCGPCKALAPTIEKLADDYEGRARIGKLDVEAEGSVSQKYGVRGLPTVLIFHKGEPQTTIMGANPAEKYASIIDALLGGGDVSIENNETMRAMSFTQAIMTADIDTVKDLLEKDRSLVNKPLETGLKPLNASFRMQQKPLTDLLMQYEPDLDHFAYAALGMVDELRREVDADGDKAVATEPDGLAAIHLASIAGQLDTVQVLLDAGADASANAEGGIELTPVISAVAGGDAEVLKLLIENGANIDAPGGHGMRAIHFAAQMGAEWAIRLLIDNGADTELQSDSGETALDLAEKGKHAEITKLLRQATDVA